MKKNTIALFGAAGKIGTRISQKLRDVAQFHMLYVEKGEVSQNRLRESGLQPTEQVEAIRQADTIILAIPDILIGTVAQRIVPQLSSNTMVILLDPAAAHGGELPSRDDVAYFVVHPCHPPIINNETTPEGKGDFFGGVAKQSIVCALMQGTEEDYLKGEFIANQMFAPILSTHRITVEQMAILEPAMAETVILTCMTVIKEAIDQAVSHGVHKQVAYDFALGHIRTSLGILFNYIDAEVSAGAKLAVENAKVQIFQSDWEKVFEPDNVLQQVQAIVKGRQS